MKNDSLKGQHRINEQIRAKEVRIVGDNIESAVYPIAQALQMADEQDMDLVEISPNAQPPVCRIIDYSKFLYQLKKRQKEQKAKQVKMNVKEIRFGPQTDDHDYNFKLKHAISFLQDGDKVKAYVNLLDLKDTDYINSNYIVLCTKKGIIKKTTLEAYSRPRQSGVNAITIKEGDQLLEAKLTNGDNDIMIAVKSGRAIRFPESKVRPMGRTAAGVIGIWMEESDEAIGMVCVEPTNANILVVSEKGYGKRSAIEDYRITNRGGKGVKTINMTEKTGSLISLILISRIITRRLFLSTVLPSRASS